MMVWQRLTVPVLTFVAGAAWMFAQAPRTPDPVAAAPHTSVPSTTASQIERTQDGPEHSDFPTARDLVSHFLFQAQPASATSTAAASSSGYSIEFLVATVPDPVDSRLPRFFDSFIESMQRAAEADGYTIDRFVLPWPQRPTQKQGSDAAWRRTLYDSRPGLMLFRDPSQQKLLLIFLVGETPTGGLHKNAMSSALDQIAEFWNSTTGKTTAGLPLRTAEPVNTIRIMGPSFSGSAVSLRFVLDQWTSAHGADWKFEIISGTATAIHPEVLSGLTPGKVSFHSTVPPDAETLKAVACYIGELGYAKLAILTESNTAYGQNAATQSSSENKSGGGSGAATCADGQPLPEMLSLPFPMHISRLREAAAKVAAAAKQTGQPSETSSAATGPIADTSSSEPREVLPEFSDLNVQATELTLTNLLSTIAREQYSYVGIVATDVRDVTFLAQEVRRHCPATVLFTLNSDLLYAYPDVNSATHGMIVVTPYPLFNLEQLWTYAYGGGKSRLQFSNQAAEGVYNATLALFQQDGKLVDYGPPLAGSTDAQTGGQHKPALWVTAIGNGETVPVGLLAWNDDSQYTYAPAASKINKSVRKPIVGRGIYSENAVLAFIVLSLLLSLFSAMMIAEYQWPLNNSLGRIYAWLADTASPAYWSECRLYLICSCASLLSFYVVVVGAFSLPFIAGSKLGTGIQTTATPIVALCIGGVTAVLLLVAVYGLAAAFRAAPSAQRGAALEVIISTFLGCAIVFALAVVLVLYWIREVHTYAASGFFNHLRSFDLAGGLSPLLPLFLVAIAACLWALCSFRRLKVLDVLRATGTVDKPHSWLTFLSLDVPSFSGVRELENNIKHTLESSTVISFRAYSILMFIAFNVWVYFFYHRLVRALELRPFYWVFGAAFFIVYWALLMEYLRLIFTWRSLHLLLQRLSWHPLLAAYKRYHENHPNLARMNLTYPPSSFASLESSVNQAGRLVSAARELARNGAEATESEIVRQCLPLWETQLQAANAQLSEALRVEWADDSRAASGSFLETAPKKRATRLGGDWRQSLRARCLAHQALFQLLRSLGKIMEAHWSGNPRHAISASTPAWKEFFDAVEEFVASRVVNFLAVIFASLQNLALFALTGLLLMLLAVTCYPFQPRGEFLFFNWVVILSFIGTVFWIFIQMDRDTVLSLLNGTEPGRISINRELVFRLAVYLAVPLLALFGAQFPDTVRQILSVFTSTQAGP